MELSEYDIQYVLKGSKKSQDLEDVVEVILLIGDETSPE